MSTALPVRSGSGPVTAHASAVEADVPVRAIGRLPVCGAGGAPAAPPYAISLPSGEIRNAFCETCVLSNDATPITFEPMPGTPPLQTPFAPELPIDATTVTPALTRFDEAWPVGD